MTRLAPADKADYRFFHQVRIRWAEVDAQGIVFNAQYFFLFDVGMTEFFRHVGLPAGMADQGGRGEMFTAASACNYHAPAHFDDLVDIGVRLKTLGRSSLTMAVGIWRGDTLLSTGEMVYVYANPETRTAEPIPQAFRAILQDLAPEAVAPGA